jgi:hypothetical protein
MELNSCRWSRSYLVEGESMITAEDLNIMMFV